MGAPASDEDLGVLAEEVAAAACGRPSDRDRVCRRAERRLAALGGAASGVGAVRLATTVRDARLGLIGEARDVSSARSAAKAAWAAQRLTMEPVLREAKRGGGDGSTRRLVAESVDEAQRAFAPVLEGLLQQGADGDAGPGGAAAHVVLMALGDLERYREAYVTNSSKGGEAKKLGGGGGGRRRPGVAAALYRRALRLRGDSGRCAYMLATVCSGEKRFGAASHWALRAIAAAEPWPAASGGLDAFAHECRAVLKDEDHAFPRTWRGALDAAEYHFALVAACCQSGVSGAGGAAATVRRHGAAAVNLAKAAARQAPTDDANGTHVFRESAARLGAGHGFPSATIPT